MSASYNFRNNFIRLRKGEENEGVTNRFFGCSAVSGVGDAYQVINMFKACPILKCCHANETEVLKERQHLKDDFSSGSNAQV